MQRCTNNNSCENRKIKNLTVFVYEQMQFKALKFLISWKEKTGFKN